MLSTLPARQRSLQRCRRTHCIGRCPPCHSGSTPQPPAWGQGTGQVSQPAATPHSNATERCGQAASTHKRHAPDYAAAREQQTQHQQRGVGPARKRMQTGTLRLAASARLVAAASSSAARRAPSRSGAPMRRCSEPPATEEADHTPLCDATPSPLTRWSSGSIGARSAASESCSAAPGACSRVPAHGATCARRPLGSPPAAAAQERCCDSTCRSAGPAGGRTSACEP